MSKCHSAGVWSMGYNILRFMLKTYSPLGGLFWIPAGSQQADRGACICESRLLDSFITPWDLECLCNYLLRLTSNKISQPALLFLWEGDPPVISGFPLTKDL